MTDPLKPGAPTYVRGPEDNPGPNAADDPRIALLAACVVTQQQAGFGDAIDLRQFACQTCGAPGFNTGWGYVRYCCGAEQIPGDTAAEPPCPNILYVLTPDPTATPDMEARLNIAQRELTRIRDEHRITHRSLFRALSDNLEMRRLLGFWTGP